MNPAEPKPLEELFALIDVDEAGREKIVQLRGYTMVGPAQTLDAAREIAKHYVEQHGASLRLVRFSVRTVLESWVPTPEQLVAAKKHMEEQERAQKKAWGQIFTAVGESLQAEAPKSEEKEPVH